MRNARRRTGGHALHGIDGLDLDSYLFSDAPDAAPGDASGFWVSAIVRPNSITNGDAYLSSAPGGAGWLLCVSAGALVFRVANGVGTYVDSPSVAVVSGKTYVITGVFDNDASKARIYAQGIQSGTGTACSGHTPDTGGYMYIGNSGGTNGFLTCFGAAYGTGIPDDAAVAAHSLVCVSSRRMQPMDGAVRVWRPLPSAQGMTGDLGGVTMSPSTTLLAVTTSSPFWG